MSLASSATLSWRRASFLLGMFLVWVALGSPLVAYEHESLTVHMIQHLLLMTVAPALILLAARSLPVCSWPAVCWTVSTLTLIGWHVPAFFTKALHSGILHAVEQGSFLAAGFLFWWPVVQSSPRASTAKQWSILVYLFLATLPCDVLSGFLVFSDRVAYPVFLSMPRHFDWSVLEDQQCAGALMWTCVTLVYLVAAAILSTRLLLPQRIPEAL